MFVGRLDGDLVYRECWEHIEVVGGMLDGVCRWPEVKDLVRSGEVVEWWSGGVGAWLIA